MEDENEACAVPEQEGLMWRPENVKNHNLTKFRHLINEKYGAKLENYHDLHKWSCENYDLFWKEVWDFCGVVASQTYEQVIDKKVPIDKIPKWFIGAKLNYAENLLRYTVCKFPVFSVTQILREINFMDSES